MIATYLVNYEDFLVMKETSSETISIPVSKINASQIRIEK